MAGRTFASLALLARVLASPYRCQTDPDDDLVLRGRDNATHVIPGLPRNPSDYDYAVERAFVVLPPVCVSELGLEADAAGARSAGRRFWVGRVGDAAWTWRLADCACGWVVFLHGSGGFTYDNWRYALDLASAGYGVLAPDSMGNATGARYREPVADLAESLASDGDYAYWCDDEVYAGGCAAFDDADGYPLCFSSDGDAIAADPESWASYYAKVYEPRRRELSRVVDWLEASAGPLADSIWTADKLFLAGSSEGGMAASRFYDDRLHGRLSGLLVFQWSCERNYFAACGAAEAPPWAICEGACDAPILVLEAARDPAASPRTASRPSGNLDGRGAAFLRDPLAPLETPSARPRASAAGRGRAGAPTSSSARSSARSRPRRQRRTAPGRRSSTRAYYAAGALEACAARLPFLDDDAPAGSSSTRSRRPAGSGWWLPPPCSRASPLGEAPSPAATSCLDTRLDDDGGVPAPVATNEAEQERMIELAEGPARGDLV
ncbi:hypothetical protein JL721_3878 [Aureococcus anophagefferens]|nr:hypothetical protein JL721_3878 [Aureococcus anophagefferens]